MKAVASSLARAAAATAIGLLVVLVIIELGGAAFFYLQNHKLVYLNDAPAAAPAPADENTYKQRLHPYFGFAGPYSVTYQTSLGTMYTNSLGFFQREKLTLPFARSDSDFVVAVFGGSVAANLVLTPRGGVQLGPALEKLPALKGRRVVVINMAQGSGKQPQQLIELAFLLALGQSIDLAITVDGFNELALGLESYRNGLDPILPAGLILGGLAQEVMPATSGSVEYYEIAYHVSATKREVERHERAAQSARWGTAYLVDRTLLTLDNLALRKYLQRYNEAVSAAGDWPARKKMLGLDMPVDANKADKVPELYELWLRSARQMQLLATANHIGYLHIVQPNQYYSRKAFTEREKEVALSLPPDHAYRVALADGYRTLEAQMPALQERGVISAIPLFDAIREDIYIDNCCHFNARGETMLAEFVAARAGDWLAAKTAPRP